MEQKPEQHSSPMDLFHAEIARLKAEEQKTAHFQNLAPEDLTEEDRRVYERFLNDTLSLDEFETYRNSIQNQESRADFAAYLANKIMIREFEKYRSLPKPEKENPS